MERIVPQSEVIRAILLEDSPCFGGARTALQSSSVPEQSAASAQPRLISHGPHDPPQSTSVSPPPTDRRPSKHVSYWTVAGVAMIARVPCRFILAFSSSALIVPQLTPVNMKGKPMQAVRMTSFMMMNILPVRAGWISAMLLQIVTPPDSRVMHLTHRRGCAA